MWQRHSDNNKARTRNETKTYYRDRTAESVVEKKTDIPKGTNEEYYL